MYVCMYVLVHAYTPTCLKLPSRSSLSPKLPGITTTLFGSRTPEKQTCIYINGWTGYAHKHVATGMRYLTSGV